MMKNNLKLNGLEREEINGKPHFGIMCGTYIVINNLESDDFTQDPLYKKYQEILATNQKKSDLENRNITFIYRPPLYTFPLIQPATLAIKYLRWGRAYKVMKTFKQKNPPKRYRKSWLNGKRKRIRFL